MSQRHRKQSQPSALATRELPPRRSRHGRIMVGIAPRDMEDSRPSPFFKKAVVERQVLTNQATGELEVTMVEVAPARPMTLEEVQRERAKVRRAVNSTQTYGQQNDAKNMAPKGKAGAAPLKPGVKK